MKTRDLLMMPLFTAMALLAGCAAPATPVVPTADATQAAPQAAAPATPASAAPAAATPTRAADPLADATPAAPTPKISKEKALEIAIKEGMPKDALSALLTPLQIEKTYGVKSTNQAWRFLKAGKVVVVDAETGAVIHKK